MPKGEQRAFCVTRPNHAWYFRRGMSCGAPFGASCYCRLRVAMWEKWEKHFPSFSLGLWESARGWSIASLKVGEIAKLKYLKRIISLTRKRKTWKAWILPNRISSTQLVRKLPSFIKLAPEKPRKFESNLKTYQAFLGTTLLFIHSQPKVKLIQNIIEAWNFTSWTWCSRKGICWSVLHRRRARWFPWCLPSWFEFGRWPLRSGMLESWAALRNVRWWSCRSRPETW